jgi:hypothetical protein
MKASLLYRIASVLLVLFAVGHTLGFRKVDPRWGAESVVSSMQSVHFEVQGFSRSYWDFFTGFGLFVTIFILFAALLAWQLGGMSSEVLRLIPAISWSPAFCFICVTLLSFKYFFIAPIVLSGLTTLCLVLAAWSGGRSS